MSNHAEEQAIIETILDYVNEDKTQREPEVLRAPTTDYTSERVLDEEIRVLFRNFPIIVAHASSLSDPGSFVTHDSTGVPILVTRNQAGEVQAFINVCRHRGARLEDRPCGQAKTFSCPYHGWTYDTGGRLRGIRQADNFGAINKDEYGLIRLPAFERYGLIWVRPSPLNRSSEVNELDIDAWLAPMAPQLETLSLENHVLYRSWTLERAMNWHIALEGFQEQYHFCSAHRDTACSAYLDTKGVYIDQYPHVRHAVPVASIERLQELPADSRSYRQHFMTQNYLFPCNFIQVMTDHVYIHTITPVSPSRSIFQCHMLIPEAPETPKAEQHWQANYDVVRRVFDEDFKIGESIQAGLSSGANAFFTIGQIENGIQLAKKAIADALKGELTV